jgi:tRNA G18 (ribose-2'-O)-methylase SpoU
MDINYKVEALSIDKNDTLLQGEREQALPLGASSAAAAAAALAAVVGGAGDGNAGAPSTSGNDDHDHPRCYVIVHNVSKRHNVGTLLRSCTAFGVAAVCLVGGRHL